MEPTDLDLLLPDKHTNLISKSTFLIRQPALFAPVLLYCPLKPGLLQSYRTGGLPFTIHRAEAPTTDEYGVYLPAPACCFLIFQCRPLCMLRNQSCEASSLHTVGMGCWLM